MSETAIVSSKPPAAQSGLPVLTLTALGVVFGDIGTSPLYTLKTVLDATGASPPPAATLGSLSLIVWTLIVITSVKYMTLATRLDNDGEGGVLALMSLLVKRLRRPIIVLVGLFGAALIYGNGAITPAISVLSALEGLNIVTPMLQRYVLPAAVAILIVLFAVQRQGTARIGGAFGPVLMAWFAAIGLLGLWGIAQHPSVLVALNPWRGLRYLFSGGWTAFLVLGGVFLCVTGAQALCDDMGHFGRRPIRLAWSALVFPSLVLNYAGQAAIVLAGAPTTDNIFFHLCPAPLLVPMVVLATIATVIASQSTITSAFSMTVGAIHLGWLPRLRITQTSAKAYGQIYVGAVNWILMVVTLALTIGFRKSDYLAAAYGIAVSATMLMTSVLLFFAMREIWRWSVPAAAGVAGALAVVDAAFVSANLMKVAYVGYVPLLLAAMVYGVMLVWHTGAAAVEARLRDLALPIGEVMQRITRGGIPRVPGTAVFMTPPVEHDAPPVMLWHLKSNRALHEQVVILSVTVESVPWVAEGERLMVEEIAPDVWRAWAQFGFMERPDVPALLQRAQGVGCRVDLSDVTYFVGHETVVAREDGQGRPQWLARMFSFMQRNSVHGTDYFRLPEDTVVEIGRKVAI